MSDSTSHESKPKKHRSPSRKIRDTHLMAYWSDAENDIMYNWPKGSQTKSDGGLLHYTFSCKALEINFQKSNCGHSYAAKSFIEELIARGYDVKTLKFSVQLKPGARNTNVRPS